MKKIIFSLFVAASSSVFSQVIIGNGKTSISSNAVSLEFGTEKKGIVVPYATSTSVDNAKNSANVSTPPVNGTIIMDPTDKMVKFRKSGTWVNLSQGSKISATVINDIQTGKSENLDAKTIIGAASSTAPGILVLEATDKAMILPTMQRPDLAIINPAPGMIAYDTLNKQLCIFNGTEWTFWEAE